MKYYLILAALLWLMLSWFASSVGLKAEEITTGNLLTNGNFETGNANGWQTTGDVQVINDCCTLNNVASNYDLEFGDSGSISQDVNLTTNTITQEMLDNGITLSQVTEVQNGECSVSGCWGGQGAADSFTITLNIKDNNGNVIASMNSTRTDTTGINGANFTDTLIYTGTGSNVGNTNISAIDANAPANLGGPNVDNIYLSMTFDNTVLEKDTREDLKDFENQRVELPPEQPNMMPEFETITPPPMLEESTPIGLPPPVIKEKKEPEVINAKVKTEVKKEKEPETMANKIIEQSKEEETPSATEEKTEATEQKPTSEKSTTEKVSAKSNTKQKKVQSKKAINIDKIMAQVDSQIKDAAKNLEVKNIIKLKAMEGEVSLAAYKNQKFYKSKDIYLGNNLIDNRDIYSNVTLASYITNDPINKKDATIEKLKIKKQRLLIELKELKNNG
jgi:hypothetical protein